MSPFQVHQIDLVQFFGYFRDGTGIISKRPTYDCEPPAAEPTRMRD